MTRSTLQAHSTKDFSAGQTHLGEIGLLKDGAGQALRQNGDQLLKLPLVLHLQRLLRGAAARHILQCMPNPTSSSHAKDGFRC